MKKFLLFLLAGISLVSCTKNVSYPNDVKQDMFFQDANLAVESITAVPTTDSTVTIRFSTAFENNLSRIELMSSTTASTFCTTQAVDVPGNSSAKKNYSFNDSNVKNNIMYYMLRFKDNNGNWTYSPYVTVTVN